MSIEPTNVQQPKSLKDSSVPTGSDAYKLPSDEKPFVVVEHNAYAPDEQNRTPSKERSAGAPDVVDKVQVTSSEMFNKQRTGSAFPPLYKMAPDSSFAGSSNAPPVLTNDPEQVSVNSFPVRMATIPKTPPVNVTDLVRNVASGGDSERETYYRLQQ